MNPKWALDGARQEHSGRVFWTGCLAPCQAVNRRTSRLQPPRSSASGVGFFRIDRRIFLDVAEVDLWLAAQRVDSVEGPLVGRSVTPGNRRRGRCLKSEAD